MIYRTVVFGHRKCFGHTWKKSGHQNGFQAPPRKIWALWAKGGDIPAHKGAGVSLPRSCRPRLWSPPVPSSLLLSLAIPWHLPCAHHDRRDDKLAQKTRRPKHGYPDASIFGTIKIVEICWRKFELMAGDIMASYHKSIR